MAPTFFNSNMDIFVAHDLFPQSLPGDEPEPLEVIEWSMRDIPSLLAREDFNEARSVAALLLAEKWMDNR